MAGIGLASLMASCDNVDESDRFIAESKPVPDPHAVPKTLLIQEFTGIQCPNCPEGANVIHGIQQAYPGKVIAVGLHAASAGTFTQNIGSFDLRCEEADVIYKYFNPTSGLPCAIFNGTEMSSSYQMWNTMAIKSLAEPAIMTIEADTEFDADTRTATVDYTINFTADAEGDLRVMVWLMENNIVGRQYNDKTLMRDYVHNHVLRASFNGDWGESLGKKFDNGQKITGSTTMVLNEKWVAENCQAVIYVFRDSDKSVEQAAVADF